MHSWREKLYRLVALFVLTVAIVGILGIEGRHLSAELLFILLCIAVVFSVIVVAINIVQYYEMQRNATAIAEKMAGNIMADDHDLFSALFKHSPVPYILIEVDGTITSMNFAAVRLLNTQAGHLNGKNVFRYLIEDAKGRVSLFPGMLEAGVFINDEEVMLKIIGGQNRWVQLSIFSFVGDDSRRHGLMTLVDITKRKEIDQVKSEFVSLASHQLLTPVSAAKWNLELMQTESPECYSESQQAYMQKIGRIIERMNTLVHDFLNVSRLELGKLTASTEVVYLDKVFDDLVIAHEQKITERKLQLDVKIDDACKELKTDRKLLTNVIDNVLSNAIKYSHEGGSVKVRSLKERDNCMVSVTDSGIGIPADEQEQIFSKIYRASNAYKHGKSGTGLGLYIAREIMKVLGGTITFTSQEGKGATFTITLPRY